MKEKMSEGLLLTKRDFLLHMGIKTDEKKRFSRKDVSQNQKPDAKKRSFPYIGLFLCFVLFLTLFSAVPAFAEDAPEIVASGYCGYGTSKNLRWTLDGDGLLTISGAGYMHDYGYWDTKWDSREEEIKKVVIEDGVQTVGRNAFARCTAVTEITIPESVTSILHSAFSGCTSLKQITIPQAVGIINGQTFQNCRSLEEIVIPNNVTEIGESAFAFCESLKSVVFGSSLTNIGSNAFRHCSALTELDFPESLTSIGEYAFFDCNSVKSITVPSNLTAVGTNNFDSSSLERIDVAGENPVYTSENGVLFNRDKTEILCYPKASANEVYTVPDGITRIGEEVFSRLNHLKHIELPESLTEIGTGAFRYAGSLQSVTMHGKVNGIAAYTFDGCHSLQELNLPDSVAEIGAYAFNGCRSLKKLVIPKSVASIGERAFDGCIFTSLEVSPGNPVYHSDGNCLIETAEKLVLIAGFPCTIPDDGSVTALSLNAFRSYSGEVLVLSKYVTKMDPNTFSFSNVKTVYYDGTLEEYLAIEDMNQNLNPGRIPVHFTAYEEPPIITTGYCGGEGDGTNVSYTQNSLGKLILSGTGTTKPGTPGYWLHSELIVNEGVTSIADRMFYDTRYSSITLPASLESIGKEAFWHNKSLQTFILPANSRLKTIAPGAFSMTPLRAFTIPQGVTVIEEYTFSMARLQYVVIPRGVTAIRRGAFQGCGLKDVFYGGSEEEWNALPIEEYNDPLFNANIHFSAVWHTPGDPVRENEIPATCTAGGSYEEVVYCTQCGYEFSREHKTADPAGHIPGRTVRENELPATCTAAGGYDEAVFCANCPAELSRTHVETAASGHRNRIWKDKIEATATAHGHEAGDYCTDCGTYIDGDVIIHNKNGARYRVQDATWLDRETYDYCCANGDYIIFCSVCGEYGLYAKQKLIDEGVLSPEPESPPEEDDEGFFEKIKTRFDRMMSGVINFLLRLIRWFGSLKG